MSNKTVVLDFDGVIHSYKSGWQGPDVIPDPPVKGILNFLVKLKYEYGFDVVICTSRLNQKDKRTYDKVDTAIWRWLYKYGLIKYISFITNEKVPAIAYVDDRGFRFNGSFEGLADQIHTSKTWLEENAEK